MGHKGDKYMSCNMDGMVKKRIAVTVNDDLLKWADKKVKDLTFANRSHCMEVALSRLRDSMDKEAK